MSIDPTFDKRLNKVERQHRRLARGYTTRVRSDGVIVVEPKRRRPSAKRLRFLAFVVLGLFLFKAFTFASLGEVTYNERVSKLGNGTELERAGAFVMQSDPVTVFLAGFFETLQ